MQLDSGMNRSPYQFVREVLFTNGARSNFVGLDEWTCFAMVWWCIGYEASNQRMAVMTKIFSTHKKLTAAKKSLKKAPTGAYIIHEKETHVTNERFLVAYYDANYSTIVFEVVQ